MSTAARATVQSAVEESVAFALTQGEVGLGVCVYHDGEMVADHSAGIADQDSGRPVDECTLFGIGSVTKAITALALHIQADRGLVDYAMPISHYWPEFGQHGKQACTVLDALSHRSGVPIFPLDASPELMNDWDWVTQRLAGAHPIYEPGTRNAYHSYTFGWIIGELVRRTDPRSRSFSDFVREEICVPLAADSLWFGIPAELEPLVANVRDSDPNYVGNSPYPYDRIIAVPPAVAATQSVFGRSDVRRAGNPGAGAIGNARSVARVFALLAGGGELDGVRLLSDERVHLLYAPRPEGWDLVLGEGTRMGIAGFWIANPLEGQMSPAGSGIQVFGHPGSGGNIAWVDLKHRLAVAITANRSIEGRVTPDVNPLVGIGNAIRRSLGIDG